MNPCVLSLCLAAGLSAQAPDMAVPPPATDEIAPAVLLAPPPISHGDFACAFKPQCGKYEVVFIHPVSCCPVCVCFDLPCGCPKVHCGKRYLEFDYGRHSVVIRFGIFRSNVRVVYT
jgi:hypothetical protein